MGLSQFNVTTGGVTWENITLLNGTIDFNGVAGAIILDSDGDTKISANTDDTILIEIGGASDFTFTTNQFNLLTGSSINGQGSTVVPLITPAVQQALSGAGAVDVTSFYTAWTTTAADAATLADGVAVGQLKKIKLIVDGGDGTLTPTNLSGGATITFADVGDYAFLMWDGTNWIAIELGNDADGATMPVLA